MQVFQIIGGIVHWKTPYARLADIPPGTYAPDILFIEAPDHVREGWGYTDGNFIKPSPPFGWAYDDNTGTFYPLDAGTPPSPEGPTYEELLEFYQIVMAGG